MRHLHFELFGSGTPTIVIEVGSTMAGTQDDGWSAIRAELSRDYTVLLYDRANLGQSEPAPRPRSLDDFAQDLRTVIATSRVQAPYLLVGCSLGGMIVTHYASLFPAMVGGLLLLDPPHPDINAGTLALLPPEHADEPRALAELRRVAWTEQYAPLDAEESEGVDYPGSQERARVVWNLAGIPLVVLTAGINEYGADFPPEVARAYEALWLEKQRAYAALSSRSIHQVVNDSDHLIHDRRPDLVLASIRDLVSLMK